VKGCREMRETNKTSLFTVNKYVYNQTNITTSSYNCRTLSCSHAEGRHQATDDSINHLGAH